MDRLRIQKSTQPIPPLDGTSSQFEFDSKEMSSSVSQFLKQSNEIQAEIQKISKLCQQISPKNEFPASVSYPEDSQSSNSEDFTDQPDWTLINTQLDQLGLRKIPMVQNSGFTSSPDLRILSEIFLQVLNEFKLKTLQLQNSEFSLSRQSSEQQQLMMQNRNLKEKLKKSKEKSPKDKALRLKQSLKRKYDITEQKTREFASFMGREINPHKFGDLKILELILAKEEQKKRADEEKQEIYPKKNQASNHLLDMIVHQLSLNSYQEIPPAIQKMQSVLQTLPNVEKFFKLVCQEVQIGTEMKIQQVIPTIHKWKERNAKFKTLMNALGGNYQTALQRAQAISYFCKLFQTSNQELREVVKGVYFFVHELKGFLAFARKSFRLPADAAVSDVLENIVQMLKVT